MKKKISKEELIEYIQEVERDGPLSNLSDLYSTVSKHFFCSPSYAGVKLKEFNIEIKTQKAKIRRGPLSDEHLKKLQGGRTFIKQSEKIKKDGEKQEGLKELERRTPKNYHSLIKKIRQGNKGAGIRLLCLECSDYHTDEIKNCPIQQCPLWIFRPYQDKRKE